MNHDETRPADGSVFGWLDNGTVTALIIYYTGGLVPVPACGRAGGPVAAVHGRRSVRHARPGTTRNGGCGGPCPPDRRHQGPGLLGAGGAEAGSGIIAVKADLPPGPDGYVLPAGRYVHYKTLRSGAALPSLDYLLADRQRVDLGLRFAVTPAGGGR